MPTFREQFTATKPGPARENLVYQAAIAMGPPKTVPVTVDGPGGTKITYKVMPNFLNIDGIYVPMTALTAQRIADHFNMQLPTAKMSQQIYDTAKNSGNAIAAKPLSGTGVTIGDKYYSGQDVVNKGVNATEFSIAYSDRVNKNITQDPNKLVDGFMKSIVQPVPGKEHKMGLHGLYDENGKPIQGGSGETPHDTTAHSEYAAGTRLVSNEVTITTPDGKVINTTMDKLLNQPKLSKAITFNPGVQRYDTKAKVAPQKEIVPEQVLQKTVKKEVEQKSTEPIKQVDNTQSILQRIEQFLDRIIA